MNERHEKFTLAIIGLGYVGLPLTLEFAKKRKVIGFDINEHRVKALKAGIDKNREFIKEEIQETALLNFTNKLEDLRLSNCYIVTVPTPVDEFNKPD